MAQESPHSCNHHGDLVRLRRFLHLFLFFDGFTMRAFPSSCSAAASLWHSPAALEWCDRGVVPRLLPRHAGIAQTNMFATICALVCFASSVSPFLSSSRVPSCHLPSLASPIFINIHFMLRCRLLGPEHSLLSLQLGCKSQRLSKTQRAFHHIRLHSLFVFACFAFDSLSRARHSEWLDVTLQGFLCKTQITNVPGTFSWVPLGVVKTF